MDLESAIEIAVAAHRGQSDKGGGPYILHPIRVMLRMRSQPEMITAILHDVLEDCEDPALVARVHAEAPREVLEALDCLTRRSDESYEQFIQRSGSNPLAKRVKLADLEDNMDIKRLATLGERELERLERYRKAWNALTQS